MGEIRPVYPAVLIAGITVSIYVDFAKVMNAVRHTFGEMVIESPLFDFVMTDYYEKEMGKNLKKGFVCFGGPFDMDRLSEIKISSNLIEKDFCTHSGETFSRQVNIDPGYVTLSKLVLASTKDFSHRIFIGKGIYAETTLRFVKGTFVPIDTTYPDYNTPLAIDFFNNCREYLKENTHIWTQKKE